MTKSVQNWPFVNIAVLLLSVVIFISVISVFSLFSVVGLALLNQCENMILPRYAARNKVTL